jgi:hypothetical protein
MEDEIQEVLKGAWQHDTMRQKIKELYADGMARSDTYQVDFRSA